MNTEELLKYLSIIIDLEKSKYTQEQTIKGLNQNLLSYQREFDNNHRLNTAFDNRVQNAVNFNNIKVDQKGKFLMYFSVYYLGSLGSYLGFLLYALSCPIGTSIVAGLISAIICGCIPIFIWKKILKERRRRAIIQIQVKARNDSRLRENRKVRNEQISLILPKFANEISVMKKTYQLTCQTLKKCYDANVIPLQYRNIVPVCTFYGYIINKRTYSLERNPNAFDEGAINMYERELIDRTIMGKLDTIIKCLNQISENQKEIRNVIQEGNREAQRLLTDINNNVTKSNKNLQNIQYQNDQRNKCVEYLSYVAYQKYY